MGRILSTLKYSQLSLSDLYASRQNNLNLIRLLAAIVVMWAHSFPLTKSKANDVLAAHGLDADVAVKAFFIISGFLVSHSWERSKSTLAYFTNRGLRIFPGLWMSIVLGCVIGAFVTTNSLTSYFTDASLWRYIGNTATLVGVPQYQLPGVFKENPVSTLNGSLWTLPYEALCYILVPLMPRKAWGLNSLPLVVIGLLAFHACSSFGNINFDPFLLGTPFFAAALSSFSFAFLVGAFWYAIADRTPVTWYTLAAALLSLYFMSRSSVVVRDWIAPCVLGYVVLSLGLLPRATRSIMSRVGDYSYGMYVYAFPIQQLLVHLFKRIPYYRLFIISLPVTAVLAILSWHRLESVCLRMKKRNVTQPEEPCPPTPGGPGGIAENN